MLNSAQITDLPAHCSSLKAIRDHDKYEKYGCLPRTSGRAIAEPFYCFQCASVYGQSDKIEHGNEGENVCINCYEFELYQIFDSAGQRNSL